MMKKLVTWYSKQKEEGRNLFWLGVISLFVFLCLTPLFFFYDIQGYSYPIGWLLASLFNLFAYLSFLFQGKTLSPKGGKSSLPIALSLMFLRFIGYAALLVVSAICTFKKEFFAGFDAFNFFTVIAALIALPFLLLILNFIAKKDRKKVIAAEEKE